MPADRTPDPVERQGARLPSHGSGDIETPEQKLRAVVSHLSRAGQRSAVAGSQCEPLGRVLVFRPWSERSLHVVGASPMVAEFRRLITAGDRKSTRLNSSHLG